MMYFLTCSIVLRKILEPNLFSLNFKDEFDPGSEGTLATDITHASPMFEKAWRTSASYTGTYFKVGNKS
jgi:hypothetical protein